MATPTKAELHALLNQYRAAVAHVLRLQMEAELTVQHLRRIGIDTADATRYEQQEILRVFREAFCAIEPRRGAGLQAGLDKEFARRDARNIAAEAADEPSAKATQTAARGGQRSK